MFTAKWLPSLKWLCNDARLSMHTRTSGGSNETEENALTVIPAGRLSLESVVTTVTPLINRPNAARNSSLFTGITQPDHFIPDGACYCPLYLFISCCKPSVEPL